jgi:hypothetical protein
METGQDIPRLLYLEKSFVNLTYLFFEELRNKWQGHWRFKVPEDVIHIVIPYTT